MAFPFSLAFTHSLISWLLLLTDDFVVLLLLVVDFDLYCVFMLCVDVDVEHLFPGICYYCSNIAKAVTNTNTNSIACCCCWLVCYFLVFFSLVQVLQINGIQTKQMQKKKL